MGSQLNTEALGVLKKMHPVRSLPCTVKFYALILLMSRQSFLVERYINPASSPRLF